MTNGLAEKRPTLRSPACIAEPKARSEPLRSPGFRGSLTATHRA